MRAMHSKGSSRRDFVRQILAMGTGLPFDGWAFSEASWARGVSAAKTGASSISPEDDRFLNELEKSNFQYFWEQANPKTGLVKDRCNVRINDSGIVGSIAATGFGLTALCIGEKRGFVP